MAKIDMPSSVVNQQYNIGIPTGSTVLRPTYQSSSVLKTQYTEDGVIYGQLQLSFTNRSSLAIKDIEIEGLTVVSIDEQGLDADSGLWTVNLTVTPTLYRTQYELTGYSYDSATAAITCSEELNISFYLALNQTNWLTVDISDSAGYYVLESDVDFSVLGSGADRFYELGEFTGTFEGSGYCLKNVELSGSAFFTNVSGATIENLMVDGLRVNGGSELYKGFIDIAEASTLSSIFLQDVEIPANMKWAGAMAGYVTGGSVSDCGVNGAVITAASGGSSIMQGGLIGQIDEVTVQNCFVRELESVNRAASSQVGIGGLVGYATGIPVIENCYAQGSVTTSYAYAGGIVGYTEGSVASCWSKVDIVSAGSYVGGIAGFATSNDADYAAQVSEWNGTNNYYIMYNLVLGELYSSTSTISNRIVGGTSTSRPTLENNSAYEGQLVNGSTSSETLGADRLVSSENVKKVSYLRVTVNLGNSYLYKSYSDEYTSYSGVTDGALPILYATDGTTVLPWQGDMAYGSAAMVIEVESATGSYVGTVGQSGEYQDLQVTLLVWMDGSETIELSEDSDALSFTCTNTVQYGDDTVTIDGESVTLQKYELTYSVTVNNYYDSYRLNVTAGSTKKSAKLTFTIDDQMTGTNAEAPLYRTIANASDWKTLMAEYGDAQENFRVIGNVDFGGDSTNTRAVSWLGISVNRLDGIALDAGGTLPYIGNLSYSTSDGSGIIDSAVTEISGLRFWKISATNSDNTTAGDNFGLIRESLASISEVTFDTISMDSKYYNYVGCIGYSQGELSGVTATDVKITTQGGNYIGTLAGYQEVAATSVVVTGTAYTNEGASNMTSSSGVSAGSASQYVGGIFGYVRGTLTDVNVSYTVVEGGKYYIGGIAGYMYFMTASRNTAVTYCKISGQRHVAGIGAYNHVSSGTCCYYTVDHCYIAATDTTGSVGGILATGGNTILVQYVSVTNSTITATGGSSAGGIEGNASYQPYDCLVEKCEIYAAKNYAGGLSGISQRAFRRNVVKDCIITTGGSYAGGLVGRYYNSSSTEDWIAFGNVVEGCTVTAGSTCAGGLFGYANIHQVYNNTVYDTTIRATDSAGGLAGYAAGGTYHHNAVQATITATNYAGGMFGSAESFYFMSGLVSSMPLKSYDSYVVADITAAVPMLQA
ncbi:MAG: hypothetical protein LIO86_03540 [Lachnospiraceae bacterium]|nr:hypothetical protein [Lachnospiraceae bacterium]